MDQRTRRLVAAAEALTLGWGGVTWVARARLLAADHPAMQEAILWKNLEGLLGI